MNKSNGGKQRKQRDTIIPMSNPRPELCGVPQKMTTETGQARGLQQSLDKCGFNVQRMKTRCSPVCAFENETCCMARLMSKQDDFLSQKCQLEEMLTERGHLCIFLPKFHCELNPIEMVGFYLFSCFWFSNLYSTGAGPNTGTERFTRKCLPMQRESRTNPLTRAQSTLSDGSLIDRGDLCQHIDGGSQGRRLNGPCANRDLTDGLDSRL